VVCCLYHENWGINLCCNISVKRLSTAFFVVSINQVVHNRSYLLQQTIRVKHLTIMDLDQIQLNQHLCTYLRKRLKKTSTVLEDIDRTLIHRARNKFQQRASITEVDLVVRRAKDLESKCMCKQSSWLDAAITLIDIKEEVLEIVLDLRFWTSMLKIAVADSDMEESEVIRSTTKVVKKT